MTTNQTDTKNKGQPSIEELLRRYTLNTIAPIDYTELELPKQCNCDLCRTKNEPMFEVVA